MGLKMTITYDEQQGFWVSNDITQLTTNVVNNFLKFIILLFIIFNSSNANACMFPFKYTASEAFENNDVVFEGINKGFHSSGDKNYILYKVNKIWKGEKANFFLGRHKA
jgi:hypothetical protein